MDYPVDRDETKNELRDLLAEKKSTAYILFSNSGIGKSATTLKFMQTINVINDGLPVKAIAARKDNSHYEEGTFLYTIFEELLKVLKKSPRKPYLKKLSFDYYVSHSKNRVLKRRIWERFFEHFYADKNKLTIGIIVLLQIMKRVFHLGDFNYYHILNENTEENRLIIAEYIKYIFINHRVILNVENTQNLDDTSLKFIMDWMNESKKQAPLFLLEYTISDSNSVQNMLFLQETLKKTQIRVIHNKLTYLESSDAVKAVEQCSGKIFSKDFSGKMKEHYINQSNGNIRDLEDFEITYDIESESASDSDIPHYNSTKANLIYRDPSEQQIIAFLYVANGKISMPLLNQLMIPNFIPDVEMLGECIKKLQNPSRLIKRNGDILEINHSSVLNVFAENCTTHFALHYNLACRNFSDALKLQFDEHDYTYYSSGQLLLNLLRLYSDFDSTLLYDLILNLDYKAMSSIKSNDILPFLQLIIEITNKDTLHNIILYKKILQICYDYEMYTDGLNFINQMQIESINDLQLETYQFLFLTELGQSKDVINRINTLRKKTQQGTRHWLVLSLMLIINYRKLNKKEECGTIADEISSYKLDCYPEYGYYLRLQALYKPRNYGMASIKKSIDFFSNNNLSVQVGKSQLALSFYLAISGDIENARKAIKDAKNFLDNTYIARHMLETNKAAIDLLSGQYDETVWESLEHAELNASKPFHLLAIFNNKLVWCLANNYYQKCDLIITRILELLNWVPDKHMHAFISYNLFLFYNAIGNFEAAELYYKKADKLKAYCHTLECRINGTFTSDGTDFLLNKPWHVCFLSHWCFDVLDYLPKEMEYHSSLGTDG